MAKKTNKDISGPWQGDLPAGRLPGGKNYLLTIAIDAYRHCPPLYNSVADAQALVRVLNERYDFEAANTITLFNEAATEGNMLHTLRDLVRTLTPADNLVLFFSGHGEFDDVLEEGYWIPVDARRGAPEDYLPNSKIRTILNAIKAHHIFLIADSCFSGSLFAQYKQVGVDRLEAFPSRWGLSSGRNEIVEDGQPGRHSPFADSLLFHLRENREALGVGALCQAVMEEVSANSSQTPLGEPLRVEGHRGGQFFFHLRASEQPMVVGAGESGSRQGSILYNIPDRMELGRDTRCEVRIAFDRSALLVTLEEQEQATIKDIRISELMEVDLLDPSDGPDRPFAVRAITSREQFLDPKEYTQWIFYVKALREGTFPLLLKVTVVEVLLGKERKREIVLEETVTVIAALEEEMAAGGYRQTGVQFTLGRSLPGIPAQIEQTQPARRIGRNLPLGLIAALALLLVAVFALPDLLQEPSDHPSALVREKVDSATPAGRLILEYQTLAEAALAEEPVNWTKAEFYYEKALSVAQDNGFVTAELQERLAAVSARPDTSDTEGQIAENVEIKSTDPRQEGGAQADTLSAELRAWQGARRQNTAVAYRDFLEEFPESRYRSLAEREIRRLDQVSVLEPEKEEDALPDQQIKGPATAKVDRLSFTDPRDQRAYDAVRVGDQYWMTSNLAYLPDAGYCYDDQKVYCHTNGVLYPWALAPTVCPPGWRLPTRADWNRLLQTAGPDKPDLQLKGLAPGGNSQLNLTPSGQRNALGNYVGFGDRGSYWGAVMGEEIEGSLWQFDFSRGTVSEERAHPEVGASCRCVKE